LLYLNGNPTQQQLEQSDAVCTALQLINFYQDIVQDYTEQDRVYIPQDELTKHGLSEIDLVNLNSQKIAPIIRDLYQRTELIMSQGFPLGTSLSGRMGWEVRAMTLGGITTLNLLTSQSNLNLINRPRLSKWNMIKVLFMSGFNHTYSKTARKLLNVAD
jgi:phytoene/squalene synthetase